MPASRSGPARRETPPPAPYRHGQHPAHAAGRALRRAPPRTGAASAFSLSRRMPGASSGSIPPPAGGRGAGKASPFAQAAREHRAEGPLPSKGRAACTASPRGHAARRAPLRRNAVRGPCPRTPRLRPATGMRRQLGRGAGERVHRAREDRPAARAGGPPPIIPVPRSGPQPRRPHHPLPRAETGQTTSTLPPRMPTYQSWTLQVGSQCPGTSRNLSLILRTPFGSSITPCSSEHLT
jgi:hypothetical protein